jgi:septal ring-binding cell division protein DamX
MSEQPEEPAGNERMLRDMERWRDRVEVSLDNKQVFFLFFGCAVVACLIFVLGVKVGKWLEARSRDQAVPTKSDPLAALEQGAEEPDEPAPKPVPKPIEKKAAPPAEKPIVEAPNPEPPKPIAELPKPPKVEPRPEPPRVEPKSEPPKVESKPEAPKVEPKPEPPKPGVSAEKLAAASKPGHYTLQLSAFQDRAEAEDFAKKLGPIGYKPNIVAADIPGRGVWYRVRVGDFASQKAALDAKSDLERKLHIIAYVTKY